MIEEPTIGEAIAEAQEEIEAHSDLALIKLIACGATNPLIARRWGISVDQLGTRIRALYADLGAVNRANAVAIAYATGLLRGMP